MFRDLNDRPRIQRDYEPWSVLLAQGVPIVLGTTSGLLALGTVFVIGRILGAF